MELPRQEYWSGLPFPSPGDLPNPGVEPHLLHCRWILYLYTTWKAQPDVNDTQIKVSGSGLFFGLQTWISTSHMIFS